MISFFSDYVLVIVDQLPRLGPYSLLYRQGQDLEFALRDLWNKANLEVKDSEAHTVSLKTRTEWKEISDFLEEWKKYFLSVKVGINPWLQLAVSQVKILSSYFHSKGSFVLGNDSFPRPSKKIEFSISKQELEKLQYRFIEHYTNLKEGIILYGQRKFPSLDSMDEKDLKTYRKELFDEILKLDTLLKSAKISIYAHNVEDINFKIIEEIQAAEELIVGARVDFGYYNILPTYSVFYV